jgi:hypothetical protein
VKSQPAFRCRPCPSVRRIAPSPARTDAERTAAARNPTSERVRAGQRGVTRAERAGCKTVGSAYVGSNPTPATTCENAPLAANSRAGGAFLLGPMVGRLVTLWTVMLRCPRTYSGQPSVRLGRSLCAVPTVGVRSSDGRRAQFRRSVRTVGVSTDRYGRAALAACPGLTRAAESSVHPCSPTRRPGHFPGPMRAVKGGCADDWGGREDHDSCRAGGRGGRGSPARSWTGYSAPGTRAGMWLPCWWTIL